MIVDLYTHLSDPQTEDTLFQWHRLLMTGRADLTEIGAYRNDAEPMQIVSGAIYAPRVHFAAPPAIRVPEEMALFPEWFSRTAPSGDTPLPALTRAGVVHLWFESTHPFENGNGRIDRALAEKALAQGLNKPAITGIAGPLLRHREDYYLALEAASRTVDVREWL